MNKECDRYTDLFSPIWLHRRLFCDGTAFPDDLLITMGAGDVYRHVE